jgi:hypothetical protein
VIGRLLKKRPEVAGVKVSFDGITFVVNYVKEDEVHTLDEKIKIDGELLLMLRCASFG